MVLADIIAWLLIGALAGLVFNRMVSGTGLGLGGDIVIGTAGALIGGFVTLLFIPSPSGYTTFSVTGVLVALIGAAILLYAVKLLSGHRSAT
jgi:uncharacterized membrane protein YeaQ/YmgE (transglycosylase-associated protein family)